VLRAALVVVAVVVLLCGIVTGVLWALQRQLIYLPGGDPGPPAAWGLLEAREVALETSDGLRLGGWYVDVGVDAPAVLVANGNAGHRGLRAPLARAVAEAGLSVLLFDYRGFGGNPGSPSEDGLATDVRAARDFLLDDAGVDPGRLIYFGESLGAGVVTELAVEHPPAGLVLRSPFTDLAAVGSVHYPFLPVRPLLRDRYPVAENVARIDVPTTVVYGEVDSIVPPSQSRAVADAAARLHRVVEVPGADHNDAVLLDGVAVVQAIVELAPS
jgi:fermentation-respiration switch protein FrsA (DUF1100 family)